METHHITPARGLSETGLKWIALVTMVLDHIHYFFSFTGCVPEWFSMVGRQALLEFRQDWSQLCQLVEKIFKEEPDE